MYKLNALSSKLLLVIPYELFVRIVYNNDFLEFLDSDFLLVDDDIFLKVARGDYND